MRCGDCARRSRMRLIQTASSRPVATACGRNICGRRNPMRAIIPRLRWTLLLGTLLAATAAAEDAPSGEKVYERWCAPCHAPGPGHPGTQSLQMKYGGKTPAVLLE